MKIISRPDPVSEQPAGAPSSDLTDVSTPDALDRLLSAVAKASLHSAEEDVSGAHTPAMPDIEALIDFAEGRLPAKQEEWVAQSLCADPVLRDLLKFNRAGDLSDPDPYSAPRRVLEKVFALMPERPSVWEVVIQRLRTGLSVLRTSGELLTPQPLAVRGGERSPSTSSGEVYCIKRALGSFSAQLIIQRKGEDRVALTLSLVDEHGTPARELYVELWQGDRLRSALSADDGAVTFTNVRTGSYTLKPRVGTLELEPLEFTMLE